jgi:transcriptional regulator with XRE-family HTH domain
MTFSAELTDVAVLREIGLRLARARLEAGLTQAETAQEAGVAKRTLERLEAGSSVDSVVLIRVLRALRLTGNLEGLLPDLPQSPVALLKSKGRQRARARRPQKATAKDAGPWKWGE